MEKEYLDIPSVDHLKQKCDELEIKFSCEEQAGVEQFRKARGTIHSLILQCIDVLQCWRQQLLAEVTGLTTVTLAQVHDRINKVQCCAQYLQTLKDNVSDPNGVLLEGDVKENINEIMQVITELDGCRAVCWPEVTACSGPDNFTELLQSLSSVALGHVGGAVHIRGALQHSPPIYRIINETKSEENICYEKQWIVLRVEVQPVGDVTPATIAPYLTASTTVAARHVPCDVHCYASDYHIDLMLQGPPCLGTQELCVTVQCFQQHLPGSPLTLTLIQGDSTAESTPKVISEKKTVVLPHTQLDDLLKQWACRSVMCGCVCGKLLSARQAVQAMNSSPSSLLFSMNQDADIPCRGECMNEIVASENNPLSSLTASRDKVSSKCKPGLGSGKTASLRSENSDSGTGTKVASSNSSSSMPHSSPSSFHNSTKLTNTSNEGADSPGDSGNFRRYDRLSAESNSVKNARKLSQASATKEQTGDYSSINLGNPQTRNGVKKMREESHANTQFGGKNSYSQRVVSFGSVKTEIASPKTTTSRFEQNCERDPIRRRNEMEVVEGGEFLPLDSSAAPTKPLKRPASQCSNSSSCDPLGSNIDSQDALLDAKPGAQDKSANNSMIDASKAEMCEVVRESLHGKCVQVFGVESNANKSNIRLKSPVGVAYLPDGSVVVCDTFNNRLVHYSEDASIATIVNTTPVLNKPSAAIMLPYIEEDCSTTAERSFAVKDHQGIFILSTNCKQLRVLGHKTLCKPYGLSVDDNGYLITVETDVGPLPCITRIHPFTGDITRVPFSLVSDPLKCSNSKPRFIACHRNDLLIVVDLGLDVIASVSMADGSVLKTFGSRGTMPGLFKDPSGVVCDADGFIIIGDSRNHRIQVFSPDGEFLSVLKVDRPLKRPSGLCLTPCGHLLVANYWENTVAKYVLTV